MQSTRVTLLQKLASESEEAWRQADDLYRPIIRKWLGQLGLQDTDAEDLTQDVMVIVSREIGSFEHSKRLGAFRAWLKTITVNRARQFFRQQRNALTPGGGTVYKLMLDEVEDPASGLSLQMDIAHDRHILNQILDEIRHEFEDTTVQAFREHAIEGVEASQVAAKLGVSRWAVYQAKSRIMRRMRQHLEHWTDELVLG